MFKSRLTIFNNTKVVFRYKLIGVVRGIKTEDKSLLKDFLKAG